MNNLRISNAGVNAAVDALAAKLNGGYLRFYSGSQPATANAPIVNQILLAELRFESPAFHPSLGGVVASAYPIAGEIERTGKATWARAFSRDELAIADMTIGENGKPNSFDVYDIDLEKVDLQAGGRCTITSMTLTLPKHD